MTHLVLPYKIPSAAVVRAGGWLLVVDDEELPLPEAVPHWDYQSTLTLRRSLAVDLQRARSESTLAPETPLTIAVVWSASGSRLKGTAARIVLPESGRVDLDIVLPGADLGGLLVLETSLVLTHRRHGDDRPIAPRRGGSTLWGDRREMRLQGDAPQFPIAIVDFTNTNFPTGAAWHLEIGSNLDAATMGSLLLLVNEKNTVVSEALKRAGNPRLQDKMALSTVYADVARTMIDHALRIPEFQDSGAYIDETLGANLQELFERLFPGRSITDIRLRAEEAPSMFASELQAAVKIFEGIE